MSSMDTGELVRTGDQLQSAASRMAEWVQAQANVPYEVRMAALEADSAVRCWTQERRKARPGEEQYGSYRS